MTSKIKRKYAHNLQIKVKHRRITRVNWITHNSVKQYIVLELATCLKIWANKISREMMITSIIIELFILAKTCPIKNLILLLTNSKMNLERKSSKKKSLKYKEKYTGAGLSKEV